MGRKPNSIAPTLELPAFLLANDKRTTVLRAALTLFLRDGYSNTSMDAVTEAAGVSKATVYAYFASKQILFETLMREGAAATFSEFPTLDRTGHDPSEELLAFFEPVLSHVLMRGGYAWDRLVIAEAVRHPQHAKLFRECALERLQAMLERYLHALHTERLINDIDLPQAAEALLTLALIGPLHDVLLLGPQTTIDRDRLQFSIQLFLRGVQRM